MLLLIVYFMQAVVAFKSLSSLINHHNSYWHYISKTSEIF